jgi:uncharacterized membrane protein
VDTSRIKLFAAIMILFILVIPAACTYHQAEEVDPVFFNGSYKEDIQPIIERNCYSCHSSTATDPKRPGYALFDDFDELKRYALKPSTVNAEFTTLQARLRQVEFPPMPLEKDPLPESEIRLIESWIKAGAPNN